MRKFRLPRTLFGPGFESGLGNRSFWKRAIGSFFAKKERKSNKKHLALFSLFRFFDKERKSNLLFVALFFSEKVNA